MEFGDNNVLGIAMGTSEAGGYIDGDGRIKGWLNELAFCPADASPTAMRDEWSGDIGCGVKYFSQDGVIKLALNAGIALDTTRPPGENLKIVQDIFKAADPNQCEAAALYKGNECLTDVVRGIFESIGVYLGHTLPYYFDLYGFKHVLLLGRVMSGEGGNIILAIAKKVLAEEYPSYVFNLHTPDEKARRVGQSVAAATL